MTTDNFPPLPSQQASQNNEIRGRTMTCSQYGQKGYNRTSCNSIFKNVDRNNRVYTYCQLKHYGKTCQKKNNDMRRNVKEEERMNKIKEQINMKTIDKNWPDLVVVQWVQEKGRKEEYVKAMKKDKNYARIYEQVEKGQKVTGIEIRDEFLYRHRRAQKGWRLIIPDHFKIQGMLAKEFLLYEAHNSTGHGGLQKTYSYLTENYSWNGSYQDTQQFISSCNLCQLAKGTTQLLVGLLTPLTVPTKP